MLLGTEFYQVPPFKVIKDTQITFADNAKDEDFSTLIAYMNHPTHMNQEAARKIYEKHEDDEQFNLLYSTYLTQSKKHEHSEIILSEYLKANPDNIEVLIKLIADCLAQDKFEKAKSLTKSLRSKFNPNVSIERGSFEQLTRLIIMQAMVAEDDEAFLEAYSWTLNEKYEDISKAIAKSFGMAKIKPMPERIEDFPEEHRPKREYPDTYFHHLELKKEPYHAPLAELDEKYMDEISLQEIRAVESLSNKDEIKHDIRWLLFKEVDNIKQQKGIFDPAGARFAFIMASSLNADYAIEDLLAYLRLPHFPYIERTFKENLVHFLLNPIFHLAENHPEPFLSFVQNDENPPESRRVLSQILNVIAKERGSQSEEIYDALQGTKFQSAILEGYRIVENKMNVMVQDFVDIPIDFFEEDEEYTPEPSGPSLADSMVELPGGGAVKKPNSLAETIFCNYLLVTMEGQQKQQAFMPPPSEGIAPLSPIMPKKKKIGRNDPCFCGSGKKYKKCCLNSFN